MIELVAWLFYTLAFAALFALRRPPLLAAGVAAAAVVIAILWRIGHSMSGEAGLGPALLMFVVAFGFASGIAARIVVLTMARTTRPASLEKIVGLVFYIGAPTLVIGWSWVQQERARARYAPPSLRCKTELHDARLGDRIVRLPLVWGIQVYEQRTSKNPISFYAQEKAREFCEATERGKPRLTLVRIDLPRLETAPETRQPICRSPRPDAWWATFCRYRRPEHTDLYSIALVDPARFDTRNYLDFTFEPAGSSATQYDSHWRQDGPFMRTGNGYDIYWRGPPRPGAASPYVARCYEDRRSRDRPAGLRCKAGYRLSSGVALLYDFRVDGSDFVPEALRQDERVSAIARSLLVP
jgi:hypothetical protein